MGPGDSHGRITGREVNVTIKLRRAGNSNFEFQIFFNKMIRLGKFPPRPTIRIDFNILLRINPIRIRCFDNKP